MLTRGRPGRARIVLAAVLLAVSAPWSSPVRADAVPKGMDWSQDYFPSADGVVLHADVFLPRTRSAQKLPVILYVSPYVGSGGTGGFVHNDPLNAGPTLDGGALGGLLDRVADAGYAFVQVTLRGYGGSGGCADFGGRGDQADVKAAVEWAASQPWSSGRVGMAGMSYSGWTGNMALATNPRGLAAVYLGSAMQNWYGYPWMNGLRNYNNVLSTEYYMQIDAFPPSLEADSRQWTGQLGRQECRAAWALAAAESRNPDPNTPWYRERDVTVRAAASRVPVLYSHGFVDRSIYPSQTLHDVFGALKGPKWLWVGQWNHLNPGSDNGAVVGRPGFLDEMLRFFDRYLKQVPDVDVGPPVVVQQGDGRWRTESSWPPSDSRPITFQLVPGTYIDHPFTSPDTADGEQLPGGKGAWTFTRPLAQDARMAGAPVVDLTISSVVPTTSLTAFVYDVAPDGSARLMSWGGTATAGAGRYRFALLPQDWLVPAGHRVGLLAAGSAYTALLTTNTGAQVSVHGTFALPLLRCLRRTYIDGGPSEMVKAIQPFGIPSTTIDAAATSQEVPGMTACSTR